MSRISAQVMSKISMQVLASACGGISLNFVLNISEKFNSKLTCLSIFVK